MSSAAFANEIIPDDVWKYLLSPLSLIDNLRLETVCKAFSRTIYCSQFRFVWCKEFQDYLYRKYKINRTQKDANQFLEGIATKIGPYCNQVVCKLYVFPSNHEQIYPKLTKMVSLYLKLYKKDGIAELSIKNSKEVFPSFHSASNAELRLFIVDPEKNYLSSDNVNFLDKLETHLTSVQLWRTEKNMANQISALTGLRKLRIQVDENVGELFSKMVTSLTKLEHLYISWDVHKVNAQIVNNLSDAMKLLKTLSTLSLEIDWNIFKFRDENDERDFIKAFFSFVSSISSTIKKMSLNVQHLNFRSPLLGSGILHTITYSRSLKYLRIVANVKDVFPLKFKGVQADTFELVFNYVKLYRQIAPFLCNSEYHSTLLPSWISETRFVFDTDGDNFLLTSVQTLKLKHCPVFSNELSDHLSTVFGDNLEKLYFQAYHESTYTSYNKSQEHVDFLSCFLDFVNKCPLLRVVKFGDKFSKKNLVKKCDKMVEINLDSLVGIFIHRAKQNPDKMFCLYIDKMQNCSLSLLKISAELKNLRIF